MHDITVFAALSESHWLPQGCHGHYWSNQVGMVLTDWPRRKTSFLNVFRIFFYGCCYPPWLGVSLLLFPFFYWSSLSSTPLTTTPLIFLSLHPPFCPHLSPPPSLLYFNHIVTVMVRCFEPKLLNKTMWKNIGHLVHMYPQWVRACLCIRLCPSAPAPPPHSVLVLYALSPSLHLTCKWMYTPAAHT